MSKETKNLQIYFGALCQPFYKQIKNQGYKAPKKEFELLQDLSRSMSMLRIHGIITDSQVPAMQKKLFKKIVKKVRELNPET